MTKKFTIVLAFLCVCHFVNAQGVKQLWGLNHWSGQLFSIDTAHFNYTMRNQMNADAEPIDFKIKNGKLYGTQKKGWFLYTFDPIAGLFTGITPAAVYDYFSPAPVSNLTVKDNIIYGATDLFIRVHQDPDDPQIVTYDKAPIYSFNTTTGIFTENITGERPEIFDPIGTMTEWNGKFYGLRKYNEGIYEYDPSNNTIINVSALPAIRLMNTSFNSYRSLTLVGNKFYGMGLDAIFEWDPTGNTVELKHQFTNQAEGTNGVGSLVEKDGKLYGMAAGSDLDNNSGVIFEYDPATDSYLKRINLNDYNLGTMSNYGFIKLGEYLYCLCQNNLAPYDLKLVKWNPTTNILTANTSLTQDIINALQVVPAPVSMFTPNSCAGFPSVTVDAVNNNTWVPVTDSKGDVLAEIHPHGNNLGLVTADAYINNDAIRTDGAGKLFLDRNMTITPANQPAEGNPVEIRLYITKYEFETLKAAPASGITDISDLAIFKNEEACSGNITTTAELMTTYEDYEFGYVLKAFVTSFSSFYFSKRIADVLPLQLLNFSGALQNDDVALQWKTDNEHNTLSFDIERSTDGIHFSIVGNVAANNTSGKHQYNFTDKDATELSASILYYRLNQKDNDGKSKYSKIISLTIPAARLVSISPNPAGSFINVKLRKQLNATNTLIQIIDAGGRKVIEQKINLSANTHKINIIGLSKGVYMISIINNGERITSKFVKE